MPKSKPMSPLAQIESSGYTIEQVAQIAKVPLHLLKDHCTRTNFMNLGQWERYQSAIGIGRIHVAEAAAKKAGVKFDRKAAMNETFDLALEETKQENIEIHAVNEKIRAEGFAKFLKHTEKRLGIKITDLDAARDVYASVLEVEARELGLR